MGNGGRRRVVWAALALFSALAWWLGVAGGWSSFTGAARTGSSSDDGGASAANPSGRPATPSRTGSAQPGHSEAEQEDHESLDDDSDQGASSALSDPSRDARSARPIFARLHPGLCADRDAPWERSRARYLATFVDVNVATQGTYNARLLVAPGTLPDVLLRVGEELNVLGTRIQDELGLLTGAATIYLYPTLEALQAQACVHPAAIAYYDGAIHLAPPSEASREWGSWPLRTLRHEYVHHVLFSAGVGEPFWFQEGVAMQMAPDNPRASDFPTEALAVEEMVGALDHSDADDSVLQRYAQSFLMVVFLRSICPYTGLNEGAMAKALSSGVVDPGSLFDWALQQCARDLDARPATLWADYARTRQLSEAIQERVRQRLVGAASAP